MSLLLLLLLMMMVEDGDKESILVERSERLNVLLGKYIQS